MVIEVRVSEPFLWTSPLTAPEVLRRQPREPDSQERAWPVLPGP